MERLIKQIECLVDRFYKTPSCNLVKCKNMHIKLLDSMRPYMDEDYVSKIDCTIEGINEAWVELQAYKEIEPEEPEELSWVDDDNRIHLIQYGEEFIVSPASERPEDNLPF